MYRVEAAGPFSFLTSRQLAGKHTFGLVTRVLMSLIFSNGKDNLI